jgi:aspartate aminotransferase-like enzyme
VRRHRRARDATRAGLRSLGFGLYAPDDRQAASVATVALPPAGIDPGPLLRAAAGIAQGGPADSGLIAAAAPGTLAGRAIRLNHTGPYAALAPVLTTLTCLGAAVVTLGGTADIAAAVAAGVQEWAAGAERS